MSSLVTIWLTLDCGRYVQLTWPSPLDCRRDWVREVGKGGGAMDESRVTSRAPLRARGAGKVALTGRYEWFFLLGRAPFGAAIACFVVFIVVVACFHVLECPMCSLFFYFSCVGSWELAKNAVLHDALSEFSPKSF